MGRYSYSSRRVLEQSYAIRIEDLVHNGLLSRGPVEASFTGKIDQTINGEYDCTLAHLFYTLAILDPILVGTVNGRDYFADDSAISISHIRDGLTYKSKHALVRQAVNFGGFRWFFRCRHCGKQCKALYYGGNAFACRHCCRMVYRTSRDHRGFMEYWHRAEQAEKKTVRLRARNHPRLANRMEQRASELWQAHEENADRLLMARWGSRF